MITNERQYRITKAQLSRINKAVKTFDKDEVAKRSGSAVLAGAELEALKSEARVLTEQLHEYDSLKSGLVKVLKAETLSDLHRILIQARIAQGLSQRQLAEILNLKEQQVQRYESEEYASASLRRLTEVANALKLSISEIAELREKRLEGRERDKRKIDWSRFPVREMYRRQWFEDFSGSIEAAMSEAETLTEGFITSIMRRPMVALHRKRIRSGSMVDEYALLAWECRVLYLAKKSPAKGKYIQSSIDNEWISGLVKESGSPNSPVRARQYLEEAGIALVIEPHLPSTHLDGAALLHQDTPVIGLTLRYDRLDNFWFVLIHELFHIIKHIRKGRIENIFDDMEEEARDRLEEEADSLAIQALIPDEVWETALARYVRSSEAVVALAEKLGISPAIIAGRIRKEANSYVILSDLVGQGDVRKHFPEVRFGQ